MKNNHKFQHRENLKVIWFSDEGKKFFDKTKTSEQYQYMGAFTAEEKEAEIERLSKSENLNSKPFVDEIVKVEAKEVTAEEKKERKKKVKENEVEISESGEENPDLKNDLKKLADGKEK